MKKFALKGLCLTSVIFSTMTFANMTNFDPKNTTPIQKLSYAFAYEMIKQSPEMDMTSFIAGAQAAFANQTLPFSEDELAKASQEVSKLHLLKLAEEADKNQKLGKEFLDKNAKNKGVKVTGSGLQYTVQKAGKGKKPKATDTVEVHYEGRLINGEIFDSSIESGKSIEFPLDQVIAGWTEGLQLMQEGAEYTFFIPANLAYGTQGPASIPPNSVLIFKVQLISIK